jgi:hypothetical protein
MVQANNVRDPISEKSQNENIFQVEECLPSKHKTLNSNPSTTKKKEQGGGRTYIIWPGIISYCQVECIKLGDKSISSSMRCL